MIYLFDKDEKLIKIVRKSAVKTALQKYALTTERYVSDRLTVELKGLNADELEQVEYMAIQTMEDAHTFHYFYVAQKSSDELTTLIGVQSGIEELRKSPVYDKRPQNAFARDVITDLLAGTNWQARFVGETTPHSTNFYYTSVFDALKKVCEVWDLEMQFFVEMNGNRIGGRYIDFKRRIGEAVGKRVVYGHNALQILQEVERTNIFTALVGRGKGEETGAGYGRKITFEDVTWSTDQGKPVNKPKGQKYLELPLMTRQYGIKNADGSMRPKIGFVDFSEEENPEVLIERTYKALIDAARPQLTLKTSSVYLKGVKIGDTIRVVRHDKKLDYDTRVFEITFNRLNNQSSDIKLGDRIGESNEAKVQTIADKAVEQFIDNEFSTFVQNLPNHLPSADGFNNNWYGAEDPTVSNPGKVLINDIWYKPDPEHEGHKIMLRWTGEAWEEILRTADNEVVKRSFEARMKDIEALKKEQADLSKRNEKELEAFRKELQGFSFDDETIDRVLSKVVDGRFDQVKEAIRAVSETSRVNAEMIGNDGTTRYNKNLLKGGTLREVALDGVPAQVEAQGGFKAGVTYTISFESLCELLQKVLVRFSQPRQKPWHIILIPSHQKLEIETTDDAVVGVYPDEYTVIISSDWYEPKTMQLSLRDAENVIETDLVYRSVADGNQDDPMLGVWAERPDIIFDGGGS
ncbi:phage tail protein [Streptococcus suis]